MSDDAATPIVPEWDTSVNKDFYAFDGATGYFKADGTTYFRPMVMKNALKPNTGKHYWEVTTTGDNMRLGLVLDGGDVTAEMGQGAGVCSLSLHTGACETAGKELKRLWRIMVPSSGGVFGCLWDSDRGVLQVWLNTEYLGCPFHDAFGLKGKTVRPCWGIAGIEENNRNIGKGMKRVTINTTPNVPPPVLP